MKHPAVIGALSCALSFTLLAAATEGYAAAPGEGPPGPEEQKSGRRGLVTWATIYGFSLYGPGTVRLLEIESER